MQHGSRLSPAAHGQVEEQTRALEALEKENMLLKAMLGDAAKPLLPPVHMQAPPPALPPQAVPPHHAGSTPGLHIQQAQEQEQQQQQHQQQQQQQQHSAEQPGPNTAMTSPVHAAAAAAAAEDASPQSTQAGSQRGAEYDGRDALQQQPEPLTQAPTSSP